MSEKKLSGIIIPMTVLAYRVKNEAKKVPALNPNYKIAEVYDLGKDVSPQAFNSNIELQKGVHLHFILPSAMKHGVEKTDSNGNLRFDYPFVPDRYIVTRMYVDKNSKKIINDCNIVESSFCSASKDYNRSITIPFWDSSKKRTYRYLGRKYSGFKQPPVIKQNEGYIKDLSAIGPGDPMFNAYYPNCHSVFGYYDDLEGVPEDAILTYSVIGYYSNAANDPFFGVKNADDMQKVLSGLNLTAEDEKVCDSCLLFGEVCGINLLMNEALPTKEINVGIGKTSVETLSAVICEKYSNENIKDAREKIERNLTMIQYDMADEVSQIDGNFKIDDSIHSYGFSVNDPLETGYEIILPKDEKIKNDNVLSDYSDLCIKCSRLGKSRRKLEFKKNTLYYLWEMYIKNSDHSSSVISAKIEETIGEIDNLRETIRKQKNEISFKLNSLKNELKNNNANIEEVSAKPFYYPKDPVLMLFGEGMNRTYAFGEDGRFEEDNSLFCLTSPLINDSYKKITDLISKKSFNSEIDEEGYLSLLIMTVILDKDNILARIDEKDNITKKYSNVMVNTDPYEEVVLFMEWETVFHNSYTNSSPTFSSLHHENTDYTYDGIKTDNYRLCIGSSVLTPHGVYNLEDKLKKYAEKHGDADKIVKLAEKIKNIPAISQNLGGFTIDLSALKYVFQMLIEDNDDALTKKVACCLDFKNPDMPEPSPERNAIVEDSEVIPLREGFLDLRKLSMVSSFGNTRKIIEDEKMISGKKYFSTNLYPIVDNCCFLPLAVTTPARLSSYFVSAANESVRSCFLPESTPVIAILMPDMLNRNLNIYDNKGELIGILKRAYERVNGQKVAVGKWWKIIDDAKPVDKRINAFVDKIVTDSDYLAELINVIEIKLNNTIHMYKNDFIFGRALVLAELCVELEYFGGTEFTKSIDKIEKTDDKGLMEQEFPVMIGDIERVTDGVICGFYDNFNKSFAAFGYSNADSKCMNDAPLTVSGNKEGKVTLLFDPSLKVTLSTGILPVEQVQLNASHTDFSGMNLMSAEMNTLISGVSYSLKPDDSQSLMPDESKINLPDFMKEDRYVLKYQKEKNEYTSLEVTGAIPAIGTISKTMIVDGLIVKDTVGKSKQ